MKIALVSDVHLEFGDLEFDNTHNADVLILGGDICVGADMTQRDLYHTLGQEYRSNRFHAFFERCCDRFPHVIFIVGNHEHYHGDFTKTVPHFKDVLGYLPNLHILEKEIWVLDDVTFIGGTLWTDMNRRDIRTLHEISRMMNDFRCVDHGAKLADQRGWGGRFTTTDAADDHDAMVEFIKTTVEANPAGRYVVVGHNAPSRLSTHPRYASEAIMNGGYSSELDDFILDHPQIKLWTHGHTHEDFDYQIGSTRILCNPRGYINYEERADTWQLVTVEV
jgi:Icc-related predicted phosphoesterase